MYAGSLTVTWQKMQEEYETGKSDCEEVKILSEEGSEIVSTN